MFNLSTMISSGKWYAEVKFTTSGTWSYWNSRSPTQTLVEILGSGDYDYGYQSNGDLYNNVGDKTLMMMKTMNFL